MSISKEEKIRMQGPEALDLLVQIMEEEGINKTVANDIYLFIWNFVQNKVTINRKSVFEKRARMVIRKFKEELNNDSDCFESSQKILQLFRDKRKSKTRLLIKDNINYILIALSVMSIVVSIILKFV